MSEGVSSLVTQVSQTIPAKRPAKLKPLGSNKGLSINIKKVRESTPRDEEEEDPNAPTRNLINSPRIDRGQWGDVPRPAVPYTEEALLPPLTPRMAGRKCLVLDLDETLVHSSFKPVDRCDFVVPVEIEGRWHQVYVAKRPHVDEFMKRMGELYEVVVFTASLSKYADPVLDLLDIHKVVDYRLFRESCSCFKGSYVKDMGRMGRPLESTMILDNSPHSYAFNPENAIPCESWFNDYEDKELLELMAVFEVPVHSYFFLCPLYFIFCILMAGSFHNRCS
eukprot:TRINITY_DN1685_c0_g1_i2.p1 TRINITY_DN1685_c0_g1~~TRINITY_DN1685_c0_g1_i2.p1  ORF type:complete len:301 (-),score=50.16 TRINITY_DN1685_c0_g1_i2:362-1198(-)